MTLHKFTTHPHEPATPSAHPHDPATHPGFQLPQDHTGTQDFEREGVAIPWAELVHQAATIPWPGPAHRERWVDLATVHFKLNVYESALLRRIADKAGDNHRRACYESLRNIGAYCGMNQGKPYKAIKRLLALGLVHSLPAPNGLGTGAGYRPMINFQPWAGPTENPANPAPFEHQSRERNPAPFEHQSRERNPAPFEHQSRERNPAPFEHQ